jgi:two-component system response regulator FixJ
MHRTARLSTRTHKNGKPDGSSVKVFVVDPDQTSAAFITDVAEAHGLTVEHFTSGEEFWDVLNPDTAGCAILEIELPGMSGIQLQERISATGFVLPVIMIATETEAAIAVRAMKLGATDFLQKPCHPLELWEAIQVSLEKDRVLRHEASIRNQIQSRLETLTSQEQRVLELVLAGKPNKTIAHILELSLRSVDFRRASILRKMQSQTLVELAQLLTRIDRSGISVVPQSQAMV